MLEGQDHQTKSQVAADRIRAAISRGELIPGTRVEIEGLIQSLRMSATPIREALRSLEADGLLHSIPYRGVWVTERSAEDEAALYDLRAVIEPYAMRAALPRLNEDDFKRLEQLLDEQARAVKEDDGAAVAACNERWHTYIYERAGGTPYLVDFIQRLWKMFPWSVTWNVGRRYERSISEHWEIMEALRAGDADGAESMLRAHILGGKTVVLEHLRQLEDGDPDR
jgi:DNA-binding GntR family transcriptional regulator